MFTGRHLLRLAATLTLAHLAQAIPAASQPSDSSAAVLYTWSNDPLCASTTTKADCAAAFASVCTSSDLSKSQKQTVQGCTAWYWFDAGNTVPTASQCSAMYAQLAYTSNGFGSLGYTAAQVRTSDPLYALYPAMGNGNCFKAPGDTSPVLAVNALPSGNLSLAQCGEHSKRDGALLAERGLPGCIIEDGAFQLGCNAVCMGTVATTAWLTWAFAVPAYMACLGVCDYAGLLLAERCFEAEEPPPSKLKRGDPLSTANKCAGIEKASFQCPALKQGLLTEYGCE